MSRGIFYSNYPLKIITNLLRSNEKCLIIVRGIPKRLELGTQSLYEHLGIGNRGFFQDIGVFRKLFQ